MASHGHQSTNFPGAPSELDWWFAGVFEGAVTAMWQHPKGTPFRAPVDSRSNPDYRKIVKKSIDLNIIRVRIGEGKYQSKADFMNDVKLMWVFRVYPSSIIHWMRTKF